MLCLCFFFFKQKTAYEMRISDWSSDVCSSDLCSHPRSGSGAWEENSHDVQASVDMKNRIRVLRAEKGWSQAELADRVRVSRNSIYAIENGRFDPSLPLAFRIADAFDPSVDDVFDKTDACERAQRCTLARSLPTPNASASCGPGRAGARPNWPTACASRAIPSTPSRTAGSIRHFRLPSGSPTPSTSVSRMYSTRRMPERGHRGEPEPALCRRRTRRLPV